jgi:hypothetical protein
VIEGNLRSLAVPIYDDTIERWANIGTIVQSIAVVLALGIVGWEFLINNRDQKEQEYGAISNIISMSVHPQYVSDALYNMYIDKEELLKREPKEFESDIGALHSYFWKIDSCIQMDICNSQEALNKFCGDFSSYRAIIRAKYNYSDEQLRARLVDLGLSTLAADCPASNTGAPAATSGPAKSS